MHGFLVVTLACLYDACIPPCAHPPSTLQYLLTQIFGADTDVGKTVFSTALALASAVCPRTSSHVPRTLAPQPGAESVVYVKPVSTGPIDDMDSRYVRSSLVLTPL